MIFTDDDLKQLKEAIALGKHPHIHPAFLARLEAAEEALEKYYNSEGEIIEGEDILASWRKAAGK